MNAHPIRAIGMGGRSTAQQELRPYLRPFRVEYEYENGARMFSQCRQMNIARCKVEEMLVGTKGTSKCGDWIPPFEWFALAASEQRRPEFPTSRSTWT
jgi:hypothetical protein